MRLPIPPLRHSLGLIKILAPGEGLEPSTLRLTAACSTIELPRNALFIGRITADNNKDYNLRGVMCQPLFRIIFYFFTHFFVIIYAQSLLNLVLFLHGVKAPPPRDPFLHSHAQFPVLYGIWRPFPRPPSSHKDVSALS